VLETALCNQDKFLCKFFREQVLHISDSGSDVSDDLSPESLSLSVDELETDLCNQDKFLCKFFRENKKLNLELESAFFEIASLRSAHDDMSARPCDN
jgi:hypothetical protein